MITEYTVELKSGRVNVKTLDGQSSVICHLVEARGDSIKDALLNFQMQLYKLAEDLKRHLMATFPQIDPPEMEALRDSYFDTRKDPKCSPTATTKSPIHPFLEVYKKMSSQELLALSTEEYQQLLYRLRQEQENL